MARRLGRGNRYWGEQSEDEEELDSDPDYQHRSDADESDDSEKGVWPTKEMRTTGYDKDYDGKYTISGDASKKLMIGDGVKDVAVTAEKEAWDTFRTTVDSTPFVFEPPPLKKIIYGNGSALTTKEAIALNKPPTEKLTEHTKALTSRIMSRGLPRVIGMAKEGLPIHEGEDPDSVKLR